MNVLVACEESQRVCAAFLNDGHNAFSCDIVEPSGGMPDRHILGDALTVVNGRTYFKTMDGHVHSCVKDSSWDIVIAHPPCTYLSKAGARHLYKDHALNYDRYILGMQAANFFKGMLYCSAKHICVENPIPLRIFKLPKYSQIIQPYEYGEPYTKSTCLWLYNLPLLQPTDIIDPVDTFCPSSKHYPGHGHGQHSKDRQRERSKTFKGIALAMAEQWSNLE